MSGNELMQQRLINLTGSEINLQRQGYVDSDSLFVRQSATAKEITEPQPIVISDIDESDEVNDLVENRIRSPFASSMVVEYVRELMGDENALDLEKWQLSNTDELIKAIMATIRGFDTNVFIQQKLKMKELLVVDLMYLRRYLLEGETVMGLEQYKELSNSEQEQFRKIVNYLFNSNYMLGYNYGNKNRLRTPNRDYNFYYVILTCFLYILKSQVMS